MESNRTKKDELRKELRENNRKFNELTDLFLANRAKLEVVNNSQKALIDEGDKIIYEQDKILIRNDEILTKLWGD